MQFDAKAILMRAADLLNGPITPAAIKLAVLEWAVNDSVTIENAKAKTDAVLGYLQEHGLLEQGRVAPIVSDVPNSQIMTQLTPSEARVVEQVMRGQPNKAIAHATGIAESTVKVHLKSVMKKLGVKNRTQLALLASRAA
jgi:DNA-binding NarL/FixJ family response regulator